jgi:hypothetical protein
MESTVVKLQGMVTAATGGNKIAQDSAKGQLRPWLGIDGEIKPIQTSLTQEDRPTIVGQIEYSLKNYGHSPAIRVGIDFSFSDHYMRRPVAAIYTESRACEKADGQSLGSGDTVNFRSIFPGDSPRLHSYPDPVSPTTSNPVRWLVGCIAYQFGKPATIYHTSVLYRLIFSKDSATSERGVQYHPIERFELIDTQMDP